MLELELKNKMHFQETIEFEKKNPSCAVISFFFFPLRFKWKYPPQLYPTEAFFCLRLEI